MRVKEAHPLFAVLRRRKWSVLIPVLIVFGMASAVAFLLPRTYVSTTTIQIEGTSVPPEHAATDPSGFADRRLRTISRRILSTQGMIEMIDRFKLYGELKNRKSTDEIVGKMRDDIEFDGIEADVAAPRPGHPASATIAFTLGYEGRDPETARNVAAELASLYIKEDFRTRERRWAEAQAAMEAGLKDARANLASLDDRIADYRRVHLASMPEHARMNLQALDQADQDIERVQERQRDLRERESDLRDRMEGMLPDDPAHALLSAQSARVGTELDALARAIKRLEGRRGVIRRRIEEAPRVEKGYRALEAERVDAQAKYNELAKKAADARTAFELEKARHGERFTIVEPALLPERPSRPNIPVILLVGLVLGLACGIGCAAMKELSDKAVYTLEQLASALPYPALAAIPFIVTPGDARWRKSPVPAPPPGP